MGRGGGAGGGSGRSSSSHSSSSRSFSSRSSSSSSGRGGSSSSRASKTFTSSHRNPSYRPAAPHGRYYGGFRRRHTYYGPGYGPHYNGWLSGLVLLFICAVLILAFTGTRTSKPGNITVSTVNREPLSGITVESGDWYEDSAGWISSKAKLTSGLKTFYKKTGVQPYLIIANEVNGKGAALTDAEAEAYLKEKYDSLFNDEGHLIFLFVEYADSEYKEYLYAGNKASSVIDLEAQEIIYDYADYYYTSDLDDDTYFSMVFEKAADRIMTKTTTNKDIALKIAGIAGAIGGIIIIGVIIIKKKKYEAQKAEEDRRILETPVDNPEDHSLKNKYK